MGRQKVNTLITLDWLREQRACEDQVAIFQGEWGDSVELSLSTLQRAEELRLDLDWLAQHILPEPIWAEYNKRALAIWAEYEKREEPIWAEYNKRALAIWAEYNKQVLAFRAEYDQQVCGVLWDAIGAGG